MFGHLDSNADGVLSAKELYDLEHDQNEHCIKPFLDTCDLDGDRAMNTREWCRCFEKTDRPCAAVRRRIGAELLGKLDAGGDLCADQCSVLNVARTLCNCRRVRARLRRAGLLQGHPVP